MSHLATWPAAAAAAANEPWRATKRHVPGQRIYYSTNVTPRSLWAERCLSKSRPTSDIGDGEMAYISGGGTLGWVRLQMYNPYRFFVSSAIDGCIDLRHGNCIAVFSVLRPTLRQMSTR